MRTSPVALLRRWGPALTVALVALLSIAMLRSSFIRWQRVLEHTVTTVDNMSESRRRLMRAYVVEQRQAQGDSTFLDASARAELDAAESALGNWMRGRSRILGIEAAPVRDSTLRAEGRRYGSALAAFRVALEAEGRDPVALRSAFAEAERSARVLQAAVHEAMRQTIEAQRRAQNVSLAGWGILLFIAGLGGLLARRSLRAAEAAGERTQSRLSLVRAVAPVGIVEADVKGRVHAANRMWSALTGREEAEWRGSVWWEAIHPEYRDPASRLWRQLVETSRHGSAELRLLDQHGGASRWVLAQTADAQDPVGERRCIVTFTDITAQRRVEEQLQHAQRMEAVGRLAGGVAHDFNNLLTSISGFAALALESAGPEDPLRDDLLEIARSADRGRALTRQLLTFSRNERIQPEPLDLSVVVQELQKMLRRLVREAIELEIEIRDQPMPVVADRGQLEQVITNLVVNAADAISERGHIRIRIQPAEVQDAFEGAQSLIEPGMYTVLTVADNGTGIPPEVQARIFEPFYTTKERGKGTGLGLSTVWGIVRQSGGHIHVYSEKGQGTTFKIYLPAGAGGLVAADTAVRESRPRPSASGTAVVVEDQDAVRKLTRRILELDGWTVLEATDGVDALEQIERHHGSIDLLVTDITMPRMGGPELRAELTRRGVEIPTLFVSGYADPDVEAAGHFLEKPFSPDALLERIGVVLEAT